MTSHWLITQPAHTASVRLYAVPYAGGNPSAFLGFCTGLGAEIELNVINLPGRGLRGNMTHATDLRQVAREIASAISADMTQRKGPEKYAIFGHSMGAVLTLEVLRICTLMHLPMPQVMVASGCRWPGVLDQTRGLHALPEPQFRARLKALGGTPQAVLDHEALMAIVSPTLRADFAMLHHYKYRTGLALTVPLHVFAGQDDAEITQEHLMPWFTESTAHGDLHWFDGGHFFLHDNPAQFTAKLREVVL